MIREPWINPDHIKRCEGKRAYRTMARAELEAERASKRTGALIIVYTCFDCRRSISERGSVLAARPRSTRRQILSALQR